MRAVCIFVAFAGVVIGPAQAAEPPAFVVPGKPGVPVMINGYDASHTIVEGDWGLDRPGAMTPTIVYGPRIGARPLYYGPYFPTVGTQAWVRRATRSSRRPIAGCPRAPKASAANGQANPTRCQPTSSRRPRRNRSS